MQNMLSVDDEIDFENNKHKTAIKELSNIITYIDVKSIILMKKYHTTFKYKKSQMPSQTQAI